MVIESNWQKMKAHAFDVISRDGGMSVAELEKVVDIGYADGELDKYEKVVLINVISNLTRVDMNDAMWAKVEELIERFDLQLDSEATIENLDDEDENNG
jgi:hypothetical protein